MIAHISGRFPYQYELWYITSRIRNGNEVMKAQCNTVINTEFGKINPASSAKRAAWPPNFASTSMAPIHHGVANHGWCILTIINKCHVMQAKPLCSGNDRRHIVRT